MRSKYPGFCRPSDQEFDALWTDCFFVLDTNVLLNLYRYSPATRENLTQIIKNLSSRMWLPHQVGDEYLNRRVEIIVEQVNTYEKMRKSVETHFDEVNQSLTKFKGHPFVPEGALNAYNNAKIIILEELAKGMAEIEHFLEIDPVLDLLYKVFEGRTGDPYTSDRSAEIAKEWETRSDKQLPPGFKDKKEGDLVIWFQIIEEAKRRNTPVILVTDDAKEDWWYKPAGRTQGPRPELIEEFLERTGKAFYMYNAPRFMEFAKSRLSQVVDQSAIDEAKGLNDLDAEQQLAEEVRELLEMIEAASQPTPHLREEAQSTSLVSPPTQSPRPEVIAEGRLAPQINTALSSAAQEFLTARESLSRRILRETPKFDLSTFLAYKEAMKPDLSALIAYKEAMKPDPSVLLAAKKAMKPDLSAFLTIKKPMGMPMKVQGTQIDTDALRSLEGAHQDRSEGIETPPQNSGSESPGSGLEGHP